MARKKKEAEPEKKKPGRPRKVNIEAAARRDSSKAKKTKKVAAPAKKKAGRPNTHKGEADKYVKALVKKLGGAKRGRKAASVEVTKKTTKKTTVVAKKGRGRPSTHKGEADKYVKGLVKKLGGSKRGRPPAAAKKRSAGRPSTHKGEADTYMKGLIKKLGGGGKRGPKKAVAAAPTKRGRGRPKGSAGPAIRNTKEIRAIHERMSGFKYNPKKMEKVRGRKPGTKNAVMHSTTGKKRGRPKGSKDSKPRAKRGSAMHNATMPSVKSAQIRATVHRAPINKIGSVKSTSTVKRSRLKAA